MDKKIQKLKNRIVILFLNDVDKLTHKKLERKVSSVENDINMLEREIFYDDPEYDSICDEIKDLRKAIKRVKLDRFIYDEELEWDLISPDRHAEGFDEDSIGLNDDFFNQAS